LRPGGTGRGLGMIENLLKSDQLTLQVVGY